MPTWTPNRHGTEAALGFCFALGSALLCVTVALELCGQLPVLWALALLADALVGVWLRRQLRRGRHDACG